jgi:hypothetical protein
MLGDWRARKRFSCNPIECAQRSLRQESSGHVYPQCHPKPDRLERCVTVITTRTVQFQVDCGSMPQVNSAGPMSLPLFPSV